VDAVAAVEVVVVALTRQLVETAGGFGKSVCRNADLGSHLVPTRRGLDHAGFQPRTRDLAAGGHRCTGDFGYRQMATDDVAIPRPVIGDEPAGDVGDPGLLALDHRVTEVHVRRGLVDEA